MLVFGLSGNASVTSTGAGIEGASEPLLRARTQHCDF